MDFWNYSPETIELSFKLFIGALYGGAIGLERQINGRPAGFRTHLLVCVASVLLMELSEGYQFLSPINSEYVRLDPGRIAAGAITGIGFIGAGVIIKMGANVLGLTTAASLWMVSAIGFAVGAGMQLPALVAFSITIFSLFALRYLETHTPRIVYKSLVIRTEPGADEEEIKRILKESSASIYRTDYEIDNIEKTITLIYTVALRRSPGSTRPKIRSMVDAIAALERVRKVSIKP